MGPQWGPKTRLSDDWLVWFLQSAFLLTFNAILELLSLRPPPLGVLGAALKPLDTMMRHVMYPGGLGIGFLNFGCPDDAERG